MSLQVYLTPNLYLQDNQLYHESNKIVKLNISNWHRYLVEYEYEKLSLGWKKRLKSSLSPKNSLWGIKDCGGDGDCLFLCLEEALKNFYQPQEDNYSVQSLRNLAAEKVTKDNFLSILENYKAEEEIGEFDGSWNPQTIRNIEELQDEIKKCGNSFWGDHIILQLLSEKLDINFIILNDENEFADEYTLQRTGTDFKQERRTIILSYYSNVHYQLVGYFNGQRMQTLFNYEDLPEEIISVYQHDCL